MQVGQASGGQRGAAGGELEERFPLVRRHPAQNSDEPHETGTEEETVYIRQRNTETLTHEGLS